MLKKKSWLKAILYLFDTCDHCRRWKLSCRMQERYMVILCRRCYEKECHAAERQRVYNTFEGKYVRRFSAAGGKHQ